MRRRSVFVGVSEMPCQCCLKLYDEGSIEREWIMPIPQMAPPRSRLSGIPMCHDCASSELVAMIDGKMDFSMARTAVGNERSESLRLPPGGAELMGMCKQWLVQPASIDDLNGHLDWLDRVVPEGDGENEC